MPKIVMFVWRLLQLLTKPFWCSLQVYGDGGSFINGKNHTQKLIRY